MGLFIKTNTFFLLSLGAIPGALFRWQIDEIFIVNLIGCFLLGFIHSSTVLRRYKLTLGVGFCGSLTTFSGWSYHLFELLNQGLYILFLFNSILTVLMGVVFIGLGYMFAKKINA